MALPTPRKGSRLSLRLLCALLVIIVLACGLAATLRTIVSVRNRRGSSVVHLPPLSQSSLACDGKSGCKRFLAVAGTIAAQDTTTEATTLPPPLPAYAIRNRSVDTTPLPLLRVNWTFFNFTEFHQHLQHQRAMYPDQDAEEVRRAYMARTANEALNSVVVSPYGVRRGNRILAGPLCVFVPANGHDSKHSLEATNFLHSWADESTVLYSESEAFLTKVYADALARGAHTVLADDEAWTVWHARQVLTNTVLERRNPTPNNIRGRGQLSIPLFHWISQLVKRDDPFVQNCKWFMKCDTDTYLRRKQLEDNVLKHLNASQPLHVGVPVSFVAKPWNSTNREIEFEYNIGGPGYTFSRALMRSVDMTECIKSMALDPILLIHDDVATGYCASYHAKGSRLVEIKTAVSSTSAGIVTELLRRTLVVRPDPQTLRCARCVSAIHPVSSLDLMNRLSQLNERQADDDTMTAAIGDGMNCNLVDDACEAFLIAGRNPRVGRGWKITQRLKDVMEFWPVGNYSYVVLANDRLRAVKAIQDRIRLLHDDE